MTDKPDAPLPEDPLQLFLWVRLFELPPAERRALALPVLLGAWSPEAWVQRALQ